VALSGGDARLVRRRERLRDLIDLEATDPEPTDRDRGNHHEHSEHHR
jgi:hypothetical protein